MSAEDAGEDKKSADQIAAEKEERARKGAADSLRRQIEKLKTGVRPRSLHEFIEHKMAEDKNKEKESGPGKQD